MEASIAVFLEGKDLPSRFIGGISGIQRLSNRYFEMKDCSKHNSSCMHASSMRYILIAMQTEEDTIEIKNSLWTVLAVLAVGVVIAILSSSVVYGTTIPNSSLSVQLSLTIVLLVLSFCYTASSG